MIRLRRIDIPGFPYHIYARGNNQQIIFQKDKDRAVYLKYLRECHQWFRFKLHAYALMDNHIHLLLEMLEGSSLGKLMHRLHLKYARYSNRAFERRGHAFESRYHANIIESDRYFMTVERYIHLNPVRAKMVARPEQYRWSSYADRLALRHSDWLYHDMTLSYFGGNTQQRLSAYKTYTEDAIGTPEEWSHEDLGKTRFFGSSHFVKRINELIEPGSTMRLNAEVNLVQRT